MHDSVIFALSLKNEYVCILLETRCTNYKRAVQVAAFVATGCLDPSRCCSYIGNVYIHRLLIVQSLIFNSPVLGLLCSAHVHLPCHCAFLAPRDIIMHHFSAVDDLHLFWLLNGSIVAYNDIDSLLRVSYYLLCLPSVPK